MTLSASVLKAAEDHIVDTAAATLVRRRHPRTRARTQPTLMELLRSLVASIDSADPRPIASYFDGLTVDRLPAGLDVADLPAALNALEEAIWTELFETLDGDDLSSAVDQMSRALGSGRDALVRSLLALTLAQRQPAADEAASTDVRATVQTEVRGDVGILTLSDPGRRNALSTRMTEEIITALDRLVSSGVRAVVLRAAADASVWSSGHDVDELPRGGRDPLAYDDPLERCLRAVRSVPIPVIAMVHGSVWGGAFDLVLSCDVVMADETATFAITPANLGLPYNTTGLLHFLGRLSVNVVKEMFFTAAPIDAEQAERWLVVNHLVPAVDLERVTFDLATQLATKAPLAIAAVKEQLRVLTDYQPVAAQVYERVQGLRRQAYDSSDYREGLAAFKEKRPPVFRGR